MVIVHHSGFGHTQKVAQAVAEGGGGTLLAIDAEGNLPADGWQQLAAAKTIVFGSPTDMGSVSLHYLFTLSQQHSMFWVGTGMMPSNDKAATRDSINNVGSFSGLMTATPSDTSVDEMVPGDIATAKLFGQRVAAATARMV